MIDYDSDKVDEVAMALLYLSLGEPNGDDKRAWKSMDFAISKRLYEKGWLEDPHNQNKSFVLTRIGREACIRLFRQYFGRTNSTSDLDESRGILSELRMNIDTLEFLYHRPESDMLFGRRYLDTAAGVIVWADDGRSDPPLSENELAMNPRYSLIPIQTTAEYISDVRAYVSRVANGELKTALQTALQSEEATPHLMNEVELLLRDNRDWEVWHRKQGTKRIRQWLSSQTATVL